MKYFLALLFFCAQAQAIVVNPACPTASATLNVPVTMPRTSCISPCLIFFDATGTTDSSLIGNTTAFQDDYYGWSFGDTLTSGSGTWAYGSNPGKNSKNFATGAVASHLYITQGRDTKYTATLTVISPNGSTVACGVGVTVFDPSGANGYPGTATVCVANSTPTAGSGGCPAGSAVLAATAMTSAFASALGTNKRLLFHCGDTFTDSGANIGVSHGSLDEYGSCTGSNRPIVSVTGGAKGIDASAEIGDWRISNLDFECSSGGFAVWLDNFPKINYQITLNNLNSNGCGEGFGFSQGAQNGFLSNVITGTGVTGIAAYFNFNQNNPPYTGHAINNLDYGAALGNSFAGVGAGGSSGVEDFRIGAARMYVVSNNTLTNANSVGAVLKLHNGNTNNSVSTWTGVYTELVEISDNYMGGSSGAQLVENAPENGADDERLRFIIFERNYLNGVTSQGGRQLLVSAVNETVRDNVFNLNGSSSLYPTAGVIADARGIEPTPTGIEIYNNTCYQPTNVGSTQNCILMAANGCCTGSPAQNSFIKNNLSYSVNGQATFVNTGAGNSTGNNTATTTASPSFTNGSGLFNVISDFKPSANYAGGAVVPVQTDALSVTWPPTWDLGAVHH